MTTEATPALNDYQMAAIENGYRYECSCGELCRTIEYAVMCRKCRTYSFFPGRYVIDICKDEVVYGTLPTEEEVREATEEYNSRRVQEEADLQAQEAAWAIELEEAGRKQAAVKIEKREDALYWLQDSLMGIRTR